MIQKIKMCYNAMFRKFFLNPPFVSPRYEIAELNIVSYGENIRLRMHSMLSRLLSGKNSLVSALMKVLQQSSRGDMRAL